MEVKPGKEGPEAYYQGGAHNEEINKHSYFKILFRLPAFLSPPNYI